MKNAVIVRNGRMDSHILTEGRHMHRVRDRHRQNLYLYWGIFWRRIELPRYHYVNELNEIM